MESSSCSPSLPLPPTLSSSLRKDTAPTAARSSATAGTAALTTSSRLEPSPHTFSTSLVSNPNFSSISKPASFSLVSSSSSSSSTFSLNM